MDLKTVLGIVVGVVLLVLVLQYMFKDASRLTNIAPAQSMQTVSPNLLAASSTSASSSNFTYSVWFFVDDWNYRYGEPKIVFGRMVGATGDKEPCPSVSLGAVQNNLSVSLAVYPGLDDAAEQQAQQQSQQKENFIVHTCSISNVPIQKWCNLLLSVYGRTLDLYLDGKLVRTCVLPGVAKVDPNATVFVTPMGGFSGWTSKLQYWPAASDPQKAWNVYRQGYGGSWLGDLFGSYTVKVSLVEGGQESGSFSL